MSRNFDQTVWNGFEALQQLSVQSSIPALATAAKYLHGRLARSGHGGPIAAYIATRGENVAPDDVVDAMDRFVKESENLPPQYEQPAFQCLSDFKKATDAGVSRLLTGFALAVCLGNKLFNLEIKIGYLY